MFLFGGAGPFDAQVEKATNENNTSEDWTQILDICDAVGNSKQSSKDCLKAIVKRLNNQDPHIVIQAITLLDACSSNCGKNFHLEIASRDFEGELKKLLGRSQGKIVEKTKCLLKKWAEGDFKTDPQLNLIPTLYNKLKSDGVDFLSSDTPKHSSTSSATVSKEDQEIAKAIELSLNETKQRQTSSSHSSPSSKLSSSLYPSVNISMSASSAPERRKVRALYDFEAAEDNELSFAAGDIIHILDDSDANWWKGGKDKMEGLFPSNFVTADLSAEPDHIIKLEQGSKKVQFAEEVEVKTLKQEPEVVEVEIDEGKIDRLLHLLHEADPQVDSNDPADMLNLEEQVIAMGPLIDAALEKVDRRHAQLTQLSSDLVDAVNFYRTLVRDPAPAPNYSNLPKMPPHMSIYPYPSQPTHMYNGMPPHVQPGYNPPGLPPGTSYNPNVSGIPMPGEYMGHHSMPGHNISMPGQFPVPGHHTGAPMPMPTHPQAGPAPPRHQNIPAGHPQQPPIPPAQMNPGAQHSSLPQGPSQLDATNLPYQPQGYLSQGVQMPAQYISTGPQQAGTISMQTPFTPANGQHMM